MTLLSSVYSKTQHLIHWRLRPLVRVALGRWMSDSDLEALSVQSYSSDKSGFKDARFNLGGLDDDEIELYQEVFGGCQTILVVGCGGGREVIGLSRLGHDALGMECCPELAEAAADNVAEAGLDARIRSAGPSDIPSDLQHSDAILIGRGVYNHLPSQAKRLQLLRACRTRLCQGSPLVVRGFHTPGDQNLGSQGVDRLGTQDFNHWTTRGELQKDFEACGFRLKDWSDVPGSRLANATAIAE